MLGQRHGLFYAPVVGSDLEPSRSEMPSHGRAHDACSDKADCADRFVHR